MSAPGTVDLMLIRAAGNGEITYEASPGGLDDLPEGWMRFVWNGRACDTDSGNKLGILADAGYLRIVDEDADQSPVEVTDAGQAEIR
jgi:hypothetical protein